MARRKRKTEGGETASKKPETTSMRLTRSATRRANSSPTELPKKNKKVEPGAKRKKEEADTERLRSPRARNVAVSRTRGITRASSSATEMPKKNKKVQPAAKRKKGEADTERLRSLRPRNMAVSRTRGLL